MANGQRQIANLIMKYQPFEKQSQGRPIEGLETVSADRTGHEVNNKNSCRLDAVKL
jgi:hypothetical protein